MWDNMTALDKGVLQTQRKHPGPGGKDVKKCLARLNGKNLLRWHISGARGTGGISLEGLVKMQMTFITVCTSFWSVMSMYLIQQFAYQLARAFDIKTFALDRDMKTSHVCPEFWKQSDAMHP